MSNQKNDAIMIGRAQNVLLIFFERRLSVPKIYLDAEWEGTIVDVLAIDRAGVGDVSVAVIRRPDQAHREIVDNLRSIPAHFKYYIETSHSLTSGKLPATETGNIIAKYVELQKTSDDSEFFSEDGVGRIGQILIDFSAGQPTARILIPPERFRSNQRIYDMADSFAASHTADFEVRP